MTTDLITLFFQTCPKYRVSFFPARICSTYVAFGWFSLHEPPMGVLGRYDDVSDTIQQKPSASVWRYDETSSESEPHHADSGSDAGLLERICLERMFSKGFYHDCIQQV